MPADRHDDRGSDGAAQALRAARPTPDPVWAAQLEQRLRPSVRRRAAPGWRVVAAAAGLAGVTGLVGLAGAGPLAPNGGDAAKARPGCAVVYVTEAEQVGEVVRSADGSVTVETRTRPVTRERERCR